MKKLFQNMIFKSTFVLACVALACGAVIAVVHMITNPIIIDAENDRIEASLKDIFPRLDGVTTKTNEGFPDRVNSKFFEIKKGNDVIGYAFTATGTNQFGDISFTMGIDMDGKIANIVFVTNGQSAGFRDIVDTNRGRFVGANINDIDSVSIQSGATFGTTLLKDLIKDVIKAYEKLDLYTPTFAEALFGKGSTRTIDATFTRQDDAPKNNSVTEKYIFEDETGTQVGVSYIVKGFGAYNESGDTGNSVIEIVFDNDDKIKAARTILSSLAGVETVDAELYYKHTPGFRPAVEAYLELLVGKTLEEALEVSVGTGSTMSKNIVKNSLSFLNTII